MPQRKSSINVYPGGKLNNLLNNFSEKLTNYKSKKTFYIILLILGIFLLVTYKKNWFIAAIVNNTPITNLELQLKLNQQFRTQTLNQLINEKIILIEANKFNAIPSEQEINKKIAELETSVGGKETLDNLLTQQGQTRNSLRDQIRIQLAITKLYEKEATVSAEDVDKFLESSRKQLKATDSAGQRKEAEDLLKQQKLSQIFNEKFTQFRQKAKIQIF